MQKILDLFSGIGGFSLGLERTQRFETVAFCETGKHPKRILKKHWPEIPIYGDIAHARFKENVDLVTAGFPCQDVSYAGEGAGISGSRSGLFWYILRAACMVGRPKLLLENVAALLHRGMPTVLGALASFGYDAEWHCIPAAEFGANHFRDRVWIIADAQGDAKQGPILQSEPGQNIFTREPRGSARTETPGTHWETGQPGFSQMDDGIPDWVGDVSGYGNAVVPQIPEMIGYYMWKAKKK